MPATQEQAAQQEAKAAQEKEMRAELLQKLLTPEANSRIKNIALVKPEKAKKLEDMVIMMGRKGQLQQPLNDGALKKMLEQISDSSDASSKKIQLNTRRFDDSDSDIDLDGL